MFCKVKATLNNRPITTVSSDPRDLNPLTPNHVLLIRSTGNMPMSVQDENPLKKRWRQVEYLTNIFWKRWTTEYITHLQLRTKWKKDSENLKIGDVVLFRDSSVPRNEWLLGRVIKTLKGKDGKVRNVGLQTKDGRQLRPVANLCLLEAVQD